MTINIQTSIQSLITTEITGMLIVANGATISNRLLATLNTISKDVSVRFSAHLYDSVNIDLSANLSKTVGISGVYANLNTQINNLPTASLSNLMLQYSSNGVSARMSIDLANMVYSAIVQSTTNSLPKKFTKSFVVGTIARGIESNITNHIRDIVTLKIEASYNNRKALDTPSLEGLDSARAIEAIQGSIVRDNEKKLKAFDSFSESNSKKLEILQKGFIDPNAVFPATPYKGIADTNKLAQGTTNGTIVQKKHDDRMVGAKLPDNESFSEPVSAYNAKYPHNKVTETLSGHVIEIDDTPNSERIHIYHKSGSYYEMDAEGNIIHRAKGSEYNIIDRNGYLSIHGTGNISVGGDIKIMVGGNAHIEVTGNTTVNCMNDMELNAAGRLTLTAGEAIDMRSPNIYMEADKELHITAEELARQHYKKLDIVVDTDMSSKVGGYMDSKAASITQEASGAISNHGGTVTTKSDTNLNLMATIAFNAKASAAVNIDGASINVNTGAASVATPSTIHNPLTAEYSKAGLISGRQDFVNEEIKDVFPDNFIDDDAYTSDDVDDAAINVSVQNDMIKKGLARPEDFMNVPVSSEIDISKPISAIGYIQADRRLLSLTETPPDNFMLSPHFSLGMLSSRAPAQASKVVAQKNLTIGQIVYNLSEVALNICEPIYAVYSNMVVTSGFRLVEESKNANSVHATGLAVDIQIRGLANAGYYDAAKRIKNIINSSDQILLESKTTGSGNSWIHCGLKNSNGEQRNQLATFHNNVKVSSGLVQIT